MSLLKELFHEINKHANDRIPEDDDDFVPSGYSTDPDDIYEMGVSAGYVRLARTLKEIIDNNT